MTIFVSECLGNKQVRDFPFELSVSARSSFSKDHMLAKWVGTGRATQGSYRGESSQFVSTRWLYCDVDNTHSEDSKDWITIDFFKEEYKDFSFVLYTSRNHMREKVDARGVSRSARPKFHALFVLEQPIDDLARFDLLLKTLASSQIYIDRATDTKRFYFGNPDTVVHWNEGCNSIEAYLEGLPSYQARLQPRSSQISHRTHSLAQDGSLLSELGKCAEEGFFDGYGDWIALGMALKNEGFSVKDWHALSWEDLDIDDCEAHWDSFNKGEITGGTLFYFIRQRNPEFRRHVDPDENQLQRLLRFVNRRS